MSIVTYDLLQAMTEQIESTLQQAVGRLGAGWGEKLRRAASCKLQPGSHARGGHRRD